MRNQPQMRADEAIQFSLRSLYARHGYTHYKMNKFEEYDLYAKNKDFLVSDSVLTFTDGNGKLLALKPDVTLSIVKNAKDVPYLQKVYYTENVYRIKKGTHSFGEIMQTGLECIGKVDNYCLCEVLSLALESLDAINGYNVLDVSHLGILSEVLDNAGVPEGEKGEVLRCIGEKNLHELTSNLNRIGVPDEKSEILKKLLKIGGEVGKTLPEIQKLLFGVVSDNSLADFSAVLSALSNKRSVRIDFSVVGDINYYNGFVFKGFVEGIPQSVLSGGEYGKLMKKMGKNADAVGFAVYLDMIGQFSRRTEDYDVDILLLYKDDDALSDIEEQVSRLTASGESVLCGKVVPEEIKYKKLMKMRNGRAENVEDDA